MHGWQSEPTDGPKGGWSCVFLERLQWLQPHLLDVVWCGVVCSVVVSRSCGCKVVAAVVVVVAVA